MNADLPLSKLQEDIHQALKSWHDTSTDTSPLDYLQLVRQVHPRGATKVRRVTNEILLNALETLAIDSEDSATLLRQHFLDGMLMNAIANRLNIGQSTAYRRQQEALHNLTLIIQTQETTAREQYQSSLEKQLRLPPETHLFGLEAKLNDLLAQTVALQTPWLTSIEGLGGIGKTALANALIRHPELIGKFQDTIWVSAKQRDFFPNFGLKADIEPALTGEGLIDAILEQLGQTASLAQSPHEKRLTLIRLLKEAPHLVVIDNLETVVDYETLLPLLWELTNPSKVLLTSRYSLRAYPDIFCLTMNALDRPEAFQLLRHEATVRGLTMLARADDGHLQQIYEVVGGNPLALKLVAGQTAFLPLSQVLNNLKAAYGKSGSELYVHIYWQAWQMLAPVSRQTLLVMPLAQAGTLSQLLALSRLEPADLYQALRQLTTLSLVEVGGDLEERRYSIHRLTETFLLTEAITWQSST